MTCTRCADRDGTRFEIPITMAFQPIVDVQAGRIFAQEALVRGTDGAGAGAILGAVGAEARYHFDQTCRVTAIRVASEIGFDADLSINFMPNAVYEPAACIQKTLQAADRYDFDPRRIIFEFTETEHVRDTAHLSGIVADYKSRGFRTALDDFGAGYSGLALLAEIQPDIVKLDRALVTGIDADPVRQEIVRAALSLCRALGIAPVVEGVETEAEVACLIGMGAQHLQGYALARPAFEAAPGIAEIVWPVASPTEAIARSA